MWFSRPPAIFFKVFLGATLFSFFLAFLVATLFSLRRYWVPPFCSLRRSRVPPFSNLKASSGAILTLGLMAAGSTLSLDETGAAVVASTGSSGDSNCSCTAAPNYVPYVSGSSTFAISCLPVTKPRWISTALAASTGLAKWLLIPATALLSQFFKERGRVSPGDRNTSCASSASSPSPQKASTARRSILAWSTQMRESRSSHGAFQDQHRWRHSKLRTAAHPALA